MRALQKLVRNGSSTQVTLPKPMLLALDWLPGDEVIVEVLEDHSVHVRLPQSSDFNRRRRKVIEIVEPAVVRP